MKRFALLASILVLSGYTAVAGQHLLNTRAPDFSLRDQYDRQYTLQSFSERPLVLLASDKAGEEQNRQWDALLQKKYGDRLQVTGVADLRAVPFFLKGKFRNDFKKDKNRILLDWDGAIFTSYGLARSVPNVVLIDGNGMVRYQYQGNPSGPAVEELFTAIDAVIEKGQ